MVETTATIDPRAATTAEALEGATLQSLLDSGLGTQAAQVRLAGFTGEFGDGGGEAFRDQAGLTFDSSGTLTQENIPIGEVTGQRVLNPQLSTAETLTPVQQTVQANELQQAQQAAAVAPVEAPAPVISQQLDAAQTAAAQTVDQQQVLGGVTTQEVTPTLTSPVETLNPATFNVNDDALVEKRLASMFADIESGTVPAWAKAAHNTAMDVMGSRGLGASTIAAGAVALSMMQSALPIAAQDAQTFFQADLATFNAKTQADLVNFQTAQQNMLTDVSIANASDQFNAASKTQTQQFTSSMIQSIQTQNASMINSMSQFNTAQENQVNATNAGNDLAAATFNAQQQSQVELFNAQIESQRNQFNSEMAFAVDQSNVIYQRQVNTANTAAQNAANQVNTQNTFNMGQTAYNNSVLQERDNVAMINQNLQNGMDRAAAITMQANDIGLVNEQLDANNVSSILENGMLVLGRILD